MGEDVYVAVDHSNVDRVRAEIEKWEGAISKVRLVEALRHLYRGAREQLASQADTGRPYRAGQWQGQMEACKALAGEFGIDRAMLDGPVIL